MDRWTGKIAVVTGASSGIGLLTAQALVKQGMIVVGLARRKTLMEEKMKSEKEAGKFHAMECDVTKAEKVKETFETIKKNFGSVHVLVNNAGLMLLGSIADLDYEKLKQTIDVNILGLIACTKEALNIMKVGEHEGHIINVGSFLGRKVLKVEGYPMNVYPASKYAVRALSESLQNELLGTKIRVTLVSPGVVNTEFFDVGGADPSFLKIFGSLDPADVADAIVYAIGTKPHVHIPQLSIMSAQDYFR